MGPIKELSFTLEEIASYMCDEYCRFPRECECEDELMEHCERCPITELMG